jgi:hypothetical protein
MQYGVKWTVTVIPFLGLVGCDHVPGDIIYQRSGFTNHGALRGVPLSHASFPSPVLGRPLIRHPPDDPPLLAYIAAVRGHRQAGPSS